MHPYNNWIFFFRDSLFHKIPDLTNEIFNYLSLIIIQIRNIFSYWHVLGIFCNSSESTKKIKMAEDFKVQMLFM